MEYLTPKQLTPECLEFANQLARWDSVEETWEVFVPLKSSVTVPCETEKQFDFSLQAAEWMEQNNIDYQFVQFENNKATVLQISG